MQSIIHLPPRRYTVLDSIGIAFRCASLVAFCYGFFDIAWVALTPMATLVAAQMIDAVVRTARNAGPVQDIYTQLPLLEGITAFGWLRSSMHNIADLFLVLAMRACYRRFGLSIGIDLESCHLLGVIRLVESGQIDMKGGV